MKILSKKRYEEIKQKLTDVALDLQSEKTDNELYKQQVEYLTNSINDKQHEVSLLNAKIDECKKEIKYLKTLLTKNGIQYKKEDKNGK